MMRASTLSLAGFITAMITALALLGGCRSESTADLLESARRSLEQRDHKTALIQLRNALEREPQSAGVRLLMARALMDSGDAGAAGVEADKAIALGAAPEEAVPLLARALLASGEAAKVIERFSHQTLGSAAAQADLLSSVSAALLQRQRDREADAVLDRALAADSASAWALVLQARRLALREDFEGALTALQRARASHPDPASVLHLQGELLAARQDGAGAQQAFEGALALRADHVPAHAALVSMALQSGQVDQARRRVDVMAKAAARAPLTLLLQGWVALAEGRTSLAEELAQQLLRAAPEDIRVLLLAGETALRNGSLAQAESHLFKAIQKAPQALQPRKMLAQTLLTGGDAGRALQVLQPVLSDGQADGLTYALAAQAQLKEGQTAKAEFLFRKAAELNPDNPRIRTAAALSQIARDPSATLRSLERIATEDRGITADLALVNSRLQSGDPDGARRAAQQIERKQPDKPLGAHLEGRILRAQGRLAEAQAAYERALRIDARHAASVIELAQIDAAEGRRSQAQSRLEALARQDGRQVSALMALADLKRQQGAAASEIEDILIRAGKAAPDSPEARLALVAHRAAQGDRDGALKAAQDAVNALPQHPATLEALGRAEAATGSTQQALGTMRKLVAQNPQNAQVLMALADVQQQVGDRGGARETLRRALDLKGDLLAAQRGLVALELMDGRPEAARSLAREIQKQRPREPVGWLLDGDIAMARQAWDEASKAYRTAQKISAGTEGAIKLLGALTAAGRKADAQAHAAEWERAHPQDIAFLMHQGEIAAAQGQWAQAEKHYQRVQRLQPDHPIALNNLAYAMARQGKPGAVALAERANRLLPDRPALLDTLALALAEDRQIDRALEVQRQAVDRAGASGSEFRLNLARLYLKAGDRQRARQELQALAGLGPRFPGHRQALELLESI